MNKTLRFSLFCLLMMFCGTLFAQTTISAEEAFSSKAGNKDDKWTVEVAPYTFTAEKNNGSTVPTYNANGKDVRIYAKGSFTISTSGAAMKKVVFNISTAGLKRLAPVTASIGTIATQAAGDNTVTWTGEATEVTFTVGDKAEYGSDGNSKAGQLDFASIEIATEGGSDVTPVTELKITGTTPFVGSTTVTISGGQQIYYTLDGSDPADETNEAALEYTGPFTINKTTTVKAFDEITEASAEATFVKTELQTVANIAAFIALEDNAQAELTLKDAVVLGAGNGNLVLKDATGSLLVYDQKKVLSLTQGQTVNGTISGTKVIYGGVAELKDIVENPIKATDGTLNPVTVEATALEGKNILEELYKVEKVDLVKKAVGNSERYYITVGEQEIIQIYDEFKLNAIEQEGNYTLEGLRGLYTDKDGNTTAQFWLTKATLEQAAPNNDKGTIDNPYTVAEALAVIAELADGKTTDKEVYVSGIVVEVTEVNTQYGNATFTINDLGGNANDILTVFRANYLEKKSFTSEDQLQDGDEVIVYGKLQKYVKNEEVIPELATGGYIYSLNGKTKDDTPELTGKGSKEEPYTVAEAVAEIEKLADGTKSASEVYVKGKIVAIDEISEQYGNATFDIADDAAAAKGVNRAEGTAAIIKVFRAKYLEETAFTSEDQLKVGDEVVVTGQLQKYVKDDVTIPEIASGGYVYSLNGETNGIETLKSTVLPNPNAPVYNLAGQQVTKAYKGVVIQNGKKFIQK